MTSKIVSPWVKEKEVLTYVGGISAVTLRAWRRDFGFPQPAGAGGINLYRKDEIETWLETNRKNGKNPAN